MISREQHSWVETATGTNAVATATRAAPSANTALAHHITSISGSYETSGTSGTLILKEGATEKGRWHVHDVFALVFTAPIKMAPGSAVSVELSASGTAGVDGAANLSGYTL